MEKKPPTGQRIADAIILSAKLHGLHGTSTYTPKERALREKARDKLILLAMARAREFSELDDDALARVVDEMAPDPLATVPVSDEARAVMVRGLEWDMDSPAIWETGADDITRLPARPEILSRFSRGKLGELEQKFKVFFLPPEVVALREEVRQALEGERWRAATRTTRARPVEPPRHSGRKPGVVTIDGDALKQLRKKLQRTQPQLTQKAFASRLRISDDTLRHIERDEPVASESSEQVFKICMRRGWISSEADLKKK